MYGIITQQHFDTMLKDILKDKKNRISSNKLRELIAKELGLNEEEMKINMLPKALENHMFSIGWVYDPIDDKYELKSKRGI